MVNDMTDQRLLSCMSSLISEEFFNVSKNSFLVKGKKKYRRPEKAFGVMLGREVIQKRFHYNPVDASYLAPRTAALPKTAFQADQAKCSLLMKELVETNPVPKWPHAGAPDLARPSADLALYREAARTKRHEEVAQHAWKGFLCDRRHKIVIKRAIE